MRLVGLFAFSKVAWALTGCNFARTSLLQGALDGGLDIPHNEKRFVGYDRSGKKLDAEVMKKYIFGGHVAEYMEEMEEEEPEKYTKHFAKFLEEDISGGDLEDLYAEVWPVAGGNGGPWRGTGGSGGDRQVWAWQQQEAAAREAALQLHAPWSSIGAMLGAAAAAWRVTGITS